MNSKIDIFGEKKANRRFTEAWIKMEHHIIVFVEEIDTEVTLRHTVHMDSLACKHSFMNPILQTIRALF